MTEWYDKEPLLPSVKEIVAKHNVSKQAFYDLYRAWMAEILTGIKEHNRQLYDEFEEAINVADEHLESTEKSPPEKP